MQDFICYLNVNFKQLKLSNHNQTMHWSDAHHRQKQYQRKQEVKKYNMIYVLY